MLEDIIKERQKKLKNLFEVGINPFPSKIKRTISIAEALKDFGKLSVSKKQLSISARIKALRDQRNLIFIDLSDESGRIQAVLKADNSSTSRIS